MVAVFALSKNSALICDVTTSAELKGNLQHSCYSQLWKTTFSSVNFFKLKYCSALNQQYDKTHLVQTGCQKNPRQESPHYCIPERNALKQEILFATGRIHKRSLVASTERTSNTRRCAGQTGVLRYVSLSGLEGVCWKLSFCSLQFSLQGRRNQNKASESFRKRNFPTVCIIKSLTHRG